MKKILNLFTILALTACTTDDDDLLLSDSQQSLLGQAVRFDASFAQPFVTRATNIHDGSFNEGDQMRIFRQYALNSDNSSFDEETEAYRTYYLKMNYATGTSVSLNSDWLPMVGKLKSDNPQTTPKPQTSADSLTWENGRTVRFRAWGRSNLAGRLNAGTKESYYPDYTVSDWVTVSGPTKSIPLTMRHITCRIGLTCEAGNEFGSATICTDWQDYKRQDNADTKANDEAETAKTNEEAKEELAQVMAVYNKMCMPAGVDDQTFLLTAMTSKLYEGTNTDFQNLEKYVTTDSIVKIATQSASDIAANVQHPVFNANDGRLYMMTIPFDMSTESAGKELALPACTRFKVWLYDVNNGDRNSIGSTGSESNYHIFVLSDIKNKDGEAIFKDGLTLKAGYSYLFSIGYHYNKLTITAEDNFSWEEQDLGSNDAHDETVQQDDLDFSWWTGAYIQAAVDALYNGKDFLPEFNIANQKQFVSFIRLVNGTAATRMSGLKRGEVRKDEKGQDIKDENGFETYWWILENETDENGQPKQITMEEAEALGYVFYPHFYPTVSTQAAHVIEDYVTGPMDFYDTDFDNRYVVNLTSDLDLYDWQLPSIGEVSKKPFRGNFRGNGHTLRNLNMESGFLFDNVMDCAITNLKIETTHSTSLLHTATASNTTTGWGCYIAGIAMLCNSNGNAIATRLDGTSSVVGCIHVGNAGGAMVGTASNLTMQGCMETASGIPSGSGALLGSYSSTAKSNFFAPLSKSNLTWGSFMCNYYDIEKSPGTHAVSSYTDNYEPQQYIRGSKSHILKAKNDYLLSADADYNKLNNDMKQEIYGLAPWKAMNYAIAKYNASAIGTKYPCKMKYKTSETGYNHLYPMLINGAPTLDSSANPLTQNN